MTPHATLVVRYDDAARAAVEQTLRKLVRKQGAALVALSILWGLITLVPLIAASTAVDGNPLPFILVSILLLAIPVALLGRFVSVSVPIWLLSLRQKIARGAVPVLTWGGLRGGVSVALALSLPVRDDTRVLLMATYAVVVFSVVVQGLTMKWIIGRTVEEAAKPGYRHGD